MASVRTLGAAHVIELRDMIKQLRHDLTAAITDGVGEPVRFELGPVQIEATVVVEGAAEADGRVRFLVVEAGGKGSASHSLSQRITLTLCPKTVAPDGTARTALIASGEVEREL